MTGIFFATEKGLIALNLLTLETTTVTSKPTNAVAVNHNLNKVYWSQGEGNASILGSNLDGSAKEIIVAPTGILKFVITKLLKAFNYTQVILRIRF